MSDETRPCEHEGCTRDGRLCQLDDDAEGDGEWLCGEHAFEHGYCACCGRFWGGIETFDFGNGLCEICRDSGDYDDGPDDTDLFGY